MVKGGDKEKIDMVKTRKHEEIFAELIPSSFLSTGLKISWPHTLVIRQRLQSHHYSAAQRGDGEGL